VPGIAFLSGGQTPAEATLHLSLINAGGSFPWQVSFSYGRALQEHTLQAWSGKSANVPAAQRELAKWAGLNRLARTGGFKAGMELQAA
jgi:fructose-bisphosphate aldolase class I